MGISLSPAVKYCVSGDRVILLDTAANRYFALPPALDRAFRTFVESAWDEIPQGDAFAGLLARRILVASDAVCAKPLPRPIARPQIAYHSAHVTQPTVSILAVAVMTRLWARSVVRRKSIAEIELALAKPIKTVASLSICETETILDRMVSAFTVVDKLMSAQDQCLSRSIAIHALCRRHGIETRMVLGVRGNPFFAHCWVEWRGAVLTGDFEHAGTFDPILVIG